MKKLFSIFLLLSFAAQGQIVKVYLYTNTTPSVVTATPAPQKYNKQWVFMFEADDSNIEGWSLFKKVSDKYSFTDGTGKRIPYKASLALNSRNNFNKAFITEDYPDKLTNAQIADIVKGGWDLSNHGAYHFDSTAISQPGWENAGWFPQQDNIKENEKYFHRKLGELGFPYVTRTWVTPTADLGYNPDLAALGYLASSSQSVTDGYPEINGEQVVTIPTINGSFKVYKRAFSDDWASYYSSSFVPKIDLLVSSASSSTQKMWRVGSHLGDAIQTKFIDSAFKYISTKGDNGWITTLQEFEEYHEVKRIVEPTKTITTNGKITTITYDFSGIPNKNRYRDMSINLGITGATSQMVYVTGVDSYTFNTTTGLLNLYTEKRTGYGKPYGAQRVTNARIPLTGDMVVTDGFSNPANGIQESWLVDDSPNDFAIGFQEYATDTVDVFIEADQFKKRNIKLNKIRMWDGGDNTANNPALFYGIKRYTGETVQLASFTGEAYMAWQEFTITDTATWDKFYLRKLKANQNSFSRLVPGKIQLYGDYTNDTTYRSAYVVAPQPFQQMFGANSYWFWTGNPADMSTKRQDQLNKAWETDRIRFYFDLCQHIMTGDSTWFFYQDSVLKWINDGGVKVNLASKSMPTHWVIANYPDSLGGERIWPGTPPSCLNGVTPAPWGSDWTDYHNYIDIAKYQFQIAARYGRNKNIDESLRKSYTSREWWNPSDSAKWGLDYVQYMSPGNENDKTWFGKKRWLTQSGEEVAAMMSACYDGHKGTMGPGVGIKTADPTMIVLPPAMVTAGNDNFMRMMRQWVIKNRGYRADGVTPDWPFDEIDFHNYSSDAGGQFQQTRGRAHEVSIAYGEVDSMLTFSGAYMNSMLANITETGWDTRDTVINGKWTGTVQNALPIGDKSVYQTQADWSVRMQLVNWIKGIKAIDFYELFDNASINSWNSLYSSTGLFWHADQGYWSGVDSVINKPSGSVLIQAKALLKNYKVDSFWLNTADSLWTIKATNGDSVKYIVWVGTEKGATVQTTVPVTEGVVYNLDYTDETPFVTPFTSQGPISFTATEKPTIILRGTAADVVVDPPPDPVDPPVNPPATYKFIFTKNKRLILKQKENGNN